ncbi:MAG: NADH-quinone oxidoreductase subunit B [Thermoprotei archaeon]|nr:MAG: NADH-quinone oxidoreductase subunit B [Thermoprotei archaeon]
MGIIQWARIKSPWILHFPSPGCNACDIEVLAALTPRYDVERFGILLKPSPRHADILIVTGAVSKQIARRLRRIYEQMPEPKFVIAVGTCAVNGNVFQGSPFVYEGVDRVIPVDVYIPGCPPRPEAIIHGVVTLIKKIRGGGNGGKR